MPDVRSGRVVFLSHCLLNQNTRYLGGAVCRGVVPGAVASDIADGTGIVQMSCPEQRVWGGVLKTRLMWVLDHPWVARAGPVLLPALSRYLRRRYTPLAREVADDIQDYLASGFAVCGVIGVSGSPTCGVHTTLDLPAAAAAVARCPRGSVTSTWLNESVVGPAQRSGTGIFIQVLADELRRRHLPVELREHELSRTDVVPPGGKDLRP
jgi:predicted secreted protein